jgi:hypothetical protein
VLFVLVLFLLYPVGSLHAFDQGHFDSPFVETVTAEVLEDQQSFVEGGYDVRIAFLPLADVSTDNNGINLEMTHELADTLVSRGVDLVPEGEVMQFLVDNRIRFSGYLDSLLARKLGREFDCRLILIGTVTEYEYGNEPSLGITLTAMDATTGSPIWAATRATSIDDQIVWLGLGEPQNINELKQPLLQDLVDELQRGLLEKMPEEEKTYQVLSARVTPSYVRGGDIVDFRLEIMFLDKHPKQILLDTKSGVMPLYRGQIDSLYRGHWVAPAAAGSYPLTLMFDWGRGDLIQSLPNVYSYTVVNEAPNLQVNLKNGLKIGDVTAFREGLIILPELQGETPVSHWELTIRGEGGNTVIKEEYDGRLPSKLVWQGTNAKRQRVEDGIYDLSLDVWDVAGNHSSATHKLALKKSTVPVEVSSVIRDGKTYLQIKRGAQSVVPLASWSIRVSSLAGDALLSKRGEFLPALLELPSIGKESTLLCDIEVEDDLGNYLSLLETKIKVQLDEPSVGKSIAPAAKSWVEDF